MSGAGAGVGALVADPAGAPASTPALEIEDLRLTFDVRGIEREAIRGVSFRIEQGESYGLVGESGCGKSTIAFAAMRHMARNARVSGGSIRLAGRDLLSMREADLRKLRQTSVSMPSKTVRTFEWKTAGRQSRCQRVGL